MLHVSVKSATAAMCGAGSTALSYCVSSRLSLLRQSDAKDFLSCVPQRGSTTGTGWDPSEQEGRV
jgi:hypothetical protein